MASLQARKFLRVFLLLSIPFLGNCATKLNVFLEAREVSRFLYDLNTDLYLVQDGTVAPILKTPILSSMIPPIEPYIKDLKFRFNATGTVQYSLSFHSSNVTIMRHPTTNIRLSGLVPRKTKGCCLNVKESNLVLLLLSVDEIRPINVWLTMGTNNTFLSYRVVCYEKLFGTSEFVYGFRVKFPCTGQVTGEILLAINISFVEMTGSKIWGPLSLVLKRYCVADKEAWINPARSNSSESGDASPLPPPQLCNKKCNKRHVMKRFCLSDFVIKARMENEIMRNGLPRLRVRVLRTFKQAKVKINSRQLLGKRGQEITCSCSNLKPGRVYIILGKEDKRRRVLYVDNFSTALEWTKNGKSFVRAFRKKALCPERRID